MESIKCALDTCKTEFIPFTAHTKFCSASCRNRAVYRKKHGVKLETKTCAARDCENKITTTRKTTKFCSKRCGHRESVNVLKDTGKWKSRSDVPKVEKICEHRNCGNTFKTAYKNNRFCSKSCGRKETVAVNNDKKPEIELECTYRYCDNIFKTKLKTVKYCCNRCFKKEQLEKNTDIRRSKNGVKNEYKVHNLDKIRHEKDIHRIPNFSARWLGDLWDNIKEEYLSDKREIA